MSNSKWVKLFKILVFNSNKIEQMNYYLIVNEEISHSNKEQYKETIGKLWFIESLIKNKIERIKFPLNNNRDVAPEPNNDLLENKLIKLGKFLVEETSVGMNVHGYKRAYQLMRV